MIQAELSGLFKNKPRTAEGGEKGKLEYRTGKYKFQRSAIPFTEEVFRNCPGVGRILAHVISVEIGDIHRFKSSGRLARYVGIVPRLYQSGQVCYHGRITKQGNKYLRTAYVEAAQTAIRRDPYL